MKFFIQILMSIIKDDTKLIQIFHPITITHLNCKTNEEYLKNHRIRLPKNASEKAVNGWIMEAIFV